ncbi:glycine zipper domain-containing protein [Desulfobulbus alkaliphilus]|uniref:glycine zipper domain-containing protein n=1 Tax=Desulfobulbus alkaliphilus TaxID=869814 RepID=UPI0019654849|nr:glycine zipper domain-containing protein [Desulfobulbus alkaliphilus]MBM9536825.1 glycine zipper 2TM domain-containing protein [Desulfobulbus alkaliphilus]
MKHLTAIIALCFLFTLSSCATKGQTGAVGGAAAGALVGQAIGHSTSATLIGAAVGTMLGYIVGNEMDKYDRQQLNHVYDRGVSNQPTSWINPDTGHQYAVTPQPAFQDPSTQRICRRAEIEALIDGRVERTYSTACRNPDGSWELQ